MKQPTELMRQILQNEIAQKIIDYVSPIYGDSYVALWIYEAIGVVLSDICILAERLRYEANPITTELLMDLWEEQYGLHSDSTLSMDERRERLLEKIRFRAPCNPRKLSDAMARVLEVPVDITERVAKNTFQVEILDSVADFRKMLHALSVLEQKKPAHLIYRVHMTSQVEEARLKLARALTQEETYKVGVQAIKLALQTTVERAIKMGAVMTVYERYRVTPGPIAIETEVDVESYHGQSASMVSTSEEYSIAAIKQAARIAVETAFNTASPVISSEELTTEEVTTQ